MKKVLKWLGIGLGVIVGLLVIGVAAAQFSTRSRLNKTYDIEVTPITIPTDGASIERGRHLAEAVIDCSGCHGKQYEGFAFLDDPSIGIIYSANLTPGSGGAGAYFTDTDWVRALRHGVGPDGKPYLVMPANQFTHMSEEDLGAVIAYIKSQPAVDRESPQSELTFMAKILFALGAFGQLPAERIDHAAAAPKTAPAEAPTAEYGEYLLSVSTCIDCHGDNFAGGKPPAPAGPNITPGGELAAWEESDFITLIRTGKDRDGEAISEEMPWETYKNMTDVELQAIWAYLQSLPALPNNE